jgi:hypothetical protein
VNPHSDAVPEEAVEALWVKLAADTGITLDEADHALQAAAPAIRSQERQRIREALRELDEIAMAAWRAREALHLNLAELGRGLDAVVTKNLADLVNDLNQHLPLGEDGFTWRTRPEVLAALDSLEEGT